MPPGTLHFAHGGKRKLARGDTLNKPSRRSHPQIGGIRSVGIYGQLQHSTANAAIFSPRAESREPRAETRDPRPDPSAGICFISLKSGNLMCAASSIITGFQNEFPQPTTCRSLTPPPPPPPHCQVLVLSAGASSSCKVKIWTDLAGRLHGFRARSSALHLVGCSCVPVSRGWVFRCAPVLVSSPRDVWRADHCGVIVMGGGDSGNGAIDPCSSVAQRTRAPSERR